MSDLFSRLQEALSPTYRLLKELGGGGMSRVFLAEEIELERRVVIKVLPPDMSAGVNKERFQREIRLAASLQHPHIVPLLTAGSAADLLYYVMPYIDGESLRTKLAREGELPIAEAARILRDVVDALAAAHRRGVVHRDIKPDNVMLSDHHALVTDFGVAKAVTASSGEGGSSLTSLGVALGTPAYMAPEQAAADPHTDHRADIYAVGALAYEILTGQPPFTGPTPQSVLAAHVTQAPLPVTQRRAAVPPVMEGLVMRCLEKRPADRWQSADELMQALSGVITPTGGMTPTQTAPVGAVSAQTALRRSHPLRVAGLFLLAAVAVLGMVYFLMIQLGLPDWVLPGAAALMAVGLPIMLATSRVERARARATMTGVVHHPSGGLRAWFTWRRAILGGWIAFGTLTLAVAGFMAMRLLGIGPAGTLLASGALSGKDRILIADFENYSPDSSLAETVTELFRIDLSQSRTVNLLEPVQVDEVLRRMGRERDTVVTIDLAREIAERQGLKAYLAGEIRTLGSGYVVAARLVAAGSGDALFAARETAGGPDEIVQAVDRLSAQLREKIGESLRDLRADPPLESVTTRSIDALRLYTAASRAGREGDFGRSIALLRQAVARDSTFAMAWRRMSAFASNNGQGALADTAARKAWSERERLGERERLLVEAMYYTYANPDNQKQIDSYRTLLEKYPDDATALNNIGLSYLRIGRYAEAEEVERRVVRNGSGTYSYANLISAQISQGRIAAAESTLRLLTDTFPDTPYIPSMSVNVAAAKPDYAAVDSLLGMARISQPRGTVWEGQTVIMQAQLAMLRGELETGLRYFRQARQLYAAIGGRSPSARGEKVTDDANRLDWEIQLDAIPPNALDLAEDIWRRHAADPDVPAKDRSYLPAAEIFAKLGNPGRARQLVQQFQANADSADIKRYHNGDDAEIEATLAVAEGRPHEAVPLYRRAMNDCADCYYPEIGSAWEHAGEIDSAVAAYRAFLETPAVRRLARDARDRARVLRRLGEINEARGNRGAALKYYGELVSLWKNADPVLQPVVKDLRARMARLGSEEGGKSGG